jgi:hypothetical protein
MGVIMNIFKKILPFIFCRPTGEKTCMKCGKRKFHVEFDGGYVDYIACSCCGARQPNTERYRI